MNIREQLGLPDLLDVKKVVAIQPHPDDNEVNIAGTLIELRQRGCEIVYVTVTDGRAGAWGEVQNAEAIVHLRHREKRAAGDIIGVSKQIDLGYPDGGDYTVEDVARDLVRVFREERPQMVFSVDPWMPYEAHPDHVKAGLAVARAMLFSHNAIVYPTDESHHPFQVEQIAFYATSYPNQFVDITSHFEVKLASILAHESQFQNDMWESMKQYFGFAATEAFRQLSPNGQGFAEPLKVLAHMQLHSVPSTVYS